MTGREHVNWVRDEIKKNAANDTDFVKAYVEDALRRRIAHQIRALREAKGWSQKDLGERMDKPQGNVSRMEDPEYGKWSLSTLFEYGRTVGVAPFFEFISYDEFMARTEDLSSARLAEALLPRKAEHDSDKDSPPPSADSRADATLFGDRADGPDVHCDLLLLREWYSRPVERDYSQCLRGRQSGFEWRTPPRGAPRVRQIASDHWLDDQQRQRTYFPVLR